MHRKSNPIPRTSSESVREFAQLLALLPPLDLNLSIAEEDSVNIMFASPVAAREVAYMLRGDWDGLNAVSIHQPDLVAIHNALAQVKMALGLEEVAFCHLGESCPLFTKGSVRVFEETRSGNSRILADFFVDDCSLA